jgi:hypothetical protein
MWSVALKKGIVHATVQEDIEVFLVSKKCSRIVAEGIPILHNISKIQERIK